MSKDFSYDVLNEPLTIHKSIIDKFLKEDRPADLIALYIFYYYTAKWQKTNQPKATTSYAAKGLGWSQDRIRRTKQTLITLGLLEDVQGRDKNNRIVGHYIKVKFIWSTDRSHPQGFPEGGVSQRVENPEGNALSPININALSPNKRNATNFSSSPPSKPISPVRQLYPNMDKYRPSYYRFVRQIQDKQIQAFPPRFRQYSPKQLESQVEAGVQVIDRLVRLDKFEFESQIKPTIFWALENDFWREQIYSLASLRNKGKNGETKFTNIWTQWVKDRNINPRLGRKVKRSDCIIKDHYGNIC